MRCDCQEGFRCAGEPEACILGPEGRENSPCDGPCMDNSASNVPARRSVARARRESLCRALYEELRGGHQLRREKVAVMRAKTDVGLESLI